MSIKETRELLQKCLIYGVFTRSGPVSGHAGPFDEPTYEAVVGFHPPPDKPHSPGWNQVQNAINGLSYYETQADDYQRQRDEVVEMLRQVIDARTEDEYRRALVAATRYLAEMDREDY